jgi:hypothetical protein
MRNNKGFLQLRRLEAARDIATLLSDSGNKVMLDAQSLLLNGRILQTESDYEGCADTFLLRSYSDG